jgi:hypothetical protein
MGTKQGLINLVGTFFTQPIFSEPNFFPHAFPKDALFINGNNTKNGGLST